MIELADARARATALDVSRSFIVRAPAGSGKTELLTRRYLALLAVARAPEEVVAITFTRKAAAEMRTRIMASFAAANLAAPEPAAPDLERWQLARAALQRDAEQGWELAQHPARLQIMTIDALNAMLAGRMPYLSGLGAASRITAEPRALYREAARRTLGALGTDEPGAAAIETLLQHLDNRAARIETLLVALLGRRDHWLRRVVGTGAETDPRALLETGWRHLVRDALEALATLVPQSLTAEITALAHYAGTNIARQQPQAPLAAWARLEGMPGGHERDLAAWQGLAELLLTRSGGWRARPGTAQGLAPRDAEAGRLVQLIGELRANEPLRQALHAARRLPEPRYPEHQWATLTALLELLPVAAAHLEVGFRARGEVDYIAVAEAALRALGGPEAPTDLALALDYRLQHLLVDEFQDTSHSQYELLLRLTAGWTPADGRTLFCVGDPMQSIYRFREAEVGLYLRARHEGLGDIRLEPLNLEVNFRSQGGVVAWVNEVFPQVLPGAEDLALGAVTYRPSVPLRDELEDVAVQVHSFLGPDPEGEARRVLELVRAARRHHEEGTIAILVSSRRHLEHIAPRLRAAGLRYQSLEIEFLARRPVVQDLVALTRALVHLGDRPAWLAVLRAPWCGLSLADLCLLAEGEREATVWELLRDPQRRALVSADGQARLRRLEKVLATALSRRSSLDLRRWVEATWLALGGPATLSDPADLDNAGAYLDRLETLEEAGDLGDTQTLESQLQELFAAPDSAADPRLQVMTIHRAKGLEFDTVIVPGLGRPTGMEDTALLGWTDIPRPGGARDVLLAPVEPFGGDRDPMYGYLRWLERERERLERGRLLYVAATRARKHLHLLGHTTTRDTPAGPALQPPGSRSLLALLWPAVSGAYQVPLQVRETAPEQTPPVPAQGICRLVADWSSPEPPPPVWVEPGQMAAAVDADAAIAFDWAREPIRQVGIAVHRLLQRIASEGLEAWPTARVAGSRQLCLRLLEEQGVPAAEREDGARLVHQALEETLADPRGRWVLAAHSEARGEYALTGRWRGHLVSAVLDRTFIDEQDRRWIIDYKTSRHEGADIQGFLDTERERYREQLERYATLLRGLEARPIHLGLYFPLLRGWREWQFAS